MDGSFLNFEGVSGMA